MKKILAIAIIALCGMIGTASAAVTTVDVNYCGASAQADFWVIAGEAVVQDTYNCGAVASDWFVSQSNLIIRGTACEIDNDGQSDDIIYVRYLASNSDGGCNGYQCASLAYADPATCQFHRRFHG
jgi:hypothetical protein